MKKVFTSPPQCIGPSPDNAEGNLVVAKGDYIVKSESTRYMAIELLGVGTFGQVFRCVSNEGDEVAVKVVKSFNKFYQYEMNGLRMLKRIKDAGLNEHFVEIYDAFIFKHHLCIIIELLGKNMFEISKILKFQGMEFYSVRSILRQLVEGLSQLQGLGIAHCDLKPENILVTDYYSGKIKIVDFGSSSSLPMPAVYYVQSRFYRAPEVILGIPYSTVIDVWSLGCIAYELLMGHPLFPGGSNTDQIHRIHEFFPGGIPQFMLEHGQHTSEYFSVQNGFFARENPDKTTMQAVIEKIHAKYGESRECMLFIDFMLKALDPSYLERWCPRSLLKHEFFSFQEPLYDVDQSREDVQTKEATMGDDAGPRRKLSMFDYGYFESEDYPRGRKGSVYDPCHENRNNRAA